MSQGAHSSPLRKQDHFPRLRGYEGWYYVIAVFVGFWLGYAIAMLLAYIGGG